MTNYLSDLRLMMEWSDTNFQSSIFFYSKFVFLSLYFTRKHQAWRPGGGSSDGEAKVKQSLEAHDYKVKCREKEELEAVLQQLETETQALEDRIMERTAEMSTNMATIDSRKENLEHIARKLRDNQ